MFNFKTFLINNLCSYEYNKANARGGDSFLDALSISSNNEGDDVESNSHSNFHRWVAYFILFLAIFSIAQFFLVVCVLYMFCKQRLYRIPLSATSSSSSSCRKISDAGATLGKDGLDIDTTIDNLDDGQRGREDIFKVDSAGLNNNNNNNKIVGLNHRERLFMRSQDARKPKFAPRRPVEFLRESPVSLRNYNL